MCVWLRQCVCVYNFLPFMLENVRKSIYQMLGVVMCIKIKGDYYSFHFPDFQHKKHIR